MAPRSDKGTLVDMTQCKGCKKMTGRVSWLITTAEKNGQLPPQLVETNPTCQSGTLKYREQYSLLIRKICFQDSSSLDQKDTFQPLWSIPLNICFLFLYMYKVYLFYSLYLGKLDVFESKLVLTLGRRQWMSFKS